MNSQSTNHVLGTYHRGYLAITSFPKWMKDNHRMRMCSAMTGSACEKTPFGEARVLTLLCPLSVSVDPEFHERMRELNLERNSARFDVDVITVDKEGHNVLSVTSYKNIRFRKGPGNVYQIMATEEHTVEVDIMNHHYQKLLTNKIQRILSQPHARSFQHHRAIQPTY